MYYIVSFFARVMFREIFDGNVYGDNNVPRKGPCIIACNHLSFFDPPFIGGVITHRKVFSLARSTLFAGGFKNWLFHSINCIPLDRDSGDIAAIRMTLKLLGKGKCVMMYPEGTRSADGSLGKAHAGIGLLAHKSRVPIIPCRIFGTFEIMPKGKKFFDWNRCANIVFGKPLMPDEYLLDGNSKEKYQITADLVMDNIRTLRVPCNG